MHAESCAAGEAVGQRSSRSVDFTDAVYHSVYGGSPAFPEHRQLPDGSRVQVRFEPNLVAWGAQRLLPVEPKKRISRADFIVLSGGRKYLCDTIVCNPACASIVSNPRPGDSTPFNRLAEGMRNKVREYNRRVKLPADMPLIVYGFDASGAWEPATAQTLTSARTSNCATRALRTTRCSRPSTHSRSGMLVSARQSWLGIGLPRPSWPLSSVRK